MIAHSKPIALPNTNNSQLAYAEGSYTDDSNGAFNPASFTRHFLGSPISWRAGSFSNRFPTAQILNSIDVSAKTTMDDSFLNAVNVFEREGELCRNYTCCNLQLNDLHALLEHFEQVHIVVLDPTSNQPQAHIQIPFNPTIHDNKKPYIYDSDDMELDIDLDTTPPPPPPPPLPPPLPSSRQSSVHSSPSPPDTPVSTPLSNYPSPRACVPHHLPNPHHLHHHAHSPYISQPPSPLSTTYDSTAASSTRQNSPTSTPNQLNLNLNLNLNLSSHGFPRATPSTNLPNPEEAFNSYARFASDYSSSMPGALFNGATVDEASALHGATAWQVQQQQQQQQQQMQEGCAPPALLFDSRPPSPTHKHQGQHRSKNDLIKALSTSSLHRHQHHQNASISSPPSSQPTSPTSSTNPHIQSLSRPPSSLLLCKPFRCPKPNCNKSYRQANGLKYHMTHGSCNFAPPKDLEHVKDLLERKRREREGMSTGDETTSSGLIRSASLGSTPATVHHYHTDQSMTTPSTPTTSSPQSLSTPSTTPPPVTGHTSSSTRPSPPTQSIKQNDRLSPSSILTYSDLSNISEHDLREVEREAERRLRPYACGIGECQRRYKNMNGLRYHYQHSGDHGALGLALLANGQHECLSAGRRNAVTSSASNPVSRGGSVSVGNSRTGTPQPLSFGIGVGSGVDVKPDVTVLAAATATGGGVGVRNTSPTQAQAQAQVYHQLQLQQFQQQQQQQMQMRDQQQRQQQQHAQQQQQRQQNQQAQAQSQQNQQQQNQQQQAQHLAAFHYAQMQRQYQAHAHAAQQQAQVQQAQQQQKSPLSSPTHTNLSSPLGHNRQTHQTTTFPPSSCSSVSSPISLGGISSPNISNTKSPIPMDLDLGMGLGMGMGADVGLGLELNPGSGVGSGSGMGFNSGMGMGFDNGMGMGSGMGSDMNMGYSMHLGMGMGMGDMGSLHHPMGPGGGHHHHQTYINGDHPTGNQKQHQDGNGMSS